MDLLQPPVLRGHRGLKAKNPDADTRWSTSTSPRRSPWRSRSPRWPALVLTAPIWLYQLWAFIVPGLLAKEKKWALIFIGHATPMFAGGVRGRLLRDAEGHHGAARASPRRRDQPQDINAYLSFLLRVMVVFGIAFLIPLIVLMLNIVGVVKAKQLSKYRTLVIFGTFVFGAVATPSTDPFSMLALAAPMTVLFLAAEVIAHILDRRKARAGRGRGRLVIAAASATTRRCASCDDDGRHPREPADRLVVNPSAGKGRALELLPQVAGTLRDGGDELDILLSRDFAEAQAMTDAPSPTASTSWP